MSHRAVTQVNAEVAPKDQILEAEPADSGRRQQGSSQAGWRDGFLQRGGSDSTVTSHRSVTDQRVDVIPWVSVEQSAHSDADSKPLYLGERWLDLFRAAPPNLGEW